ncbi:hypothetical protein [Candidatus Entotheonella palauensis]|uniref:hypothetical protein n=1 Tax=Candidatus Entotheonella palauensis TaxID=93172 RepID=UPI000B7E6E88|nr:hypothetical protein [Candidatus Entotheonella palauensis]
MCKPVSPWQYAVRLLLMVFALNVTLAGWSQAQQEVTVIVDFPANDLLPPTARAARTGAGTIASNPIGTPGTFAPATKTQLDREEKTAELAQQRPRRPYAFAASLSHERFEFNVGDRKQDGHITLSTAQMLWVINDFTLGVLLPFERIEIELATETIDFFRFGLAGLAQYQLPLNEVLTARATFLGRYSFGSFSDQNSDRHTLTLGTGASLAADLDVVSGTVGMSYHFAAEDDNPDGNETQHVVRLGGDLGVRLGRRLALTGFGAWTLDVTDYTGRQSDIDDSYGEVGGELAWSLSPTWRLQGGYKRVIALADFESDLVFLSTIVRF